MSCIYCGRPLSVAGFIFQCPVLVLIKDEDFYLIANHISTGSTHEGRRVED